MAVPSEMDNAGNGLELVRTAEEIAEEREHAITLIRDGLSIRQVKTFLVGSPTADESISLALATLRQIEDIDTNLEAGRGIARLHDLYARLHQIGDYKGCAKVQDQITKMLGLYNPKTSIAIRRAIADVVEIAGHYIGGKNAEEFLARVRDWYEKRY